MNATIAFLSKLNDGGLLFLNHYLEKRCHCNVFHISPTKRLIYDGDLHDECQRLKIKICAKEMEGKEVLYDPELKTFTYQFTINESHQYLVFFPLEAEQCSSVYEEIGDIIMPLSYYLKGLYYSFGSYKNLLKNDPEKIFQSKNEYWCSILQAQQIDPASYIRVAVIEPGVHADNLDKIQRIVTNMVLHDGNADIMIYQYQKKLVLIIPYNYQLQISLDTQKVEDHLYPMMEHHAQLEEHFGPGFRIAVGRCVCIRDVYTSYFQALASLFYLDYFRRTDELIEFKNIGPAVHIMQMNYPGYAEELEEKFKILNKYENDRSGFLFSTLRELVRCQFNYQDAAHRLHMHLNTLYYRQDKLSGLLGMDLTALEAKIMLYEEMFTYDFLHGWQENL